MPKRKRKTVKATGDDMKKPKAGASETEIDNEGKNKSNRVIKKAVPRQKTPAEPVKEEEIQVKKSNTTGGIGNPMYSTELDKIATQNSLSTHLRCDSWNILLSDLMTTDDFKSLEKAVLQEYHKATVYPPVELIFNAFNLTPVENVKVVILDQDPYHGEGQAHGLSFSVPKGVPPPPSLKNIYKELMTDIPGFKTHEHGCLEKWAKQGVLLLNATLTVRAKEPNSHAKLGWQKFTDGVIKKISDKLSGVVFILWGGFAHKKEKLIDTSRHGIVKTAHPSPLSVTKFMGCKCFSQVNELLKKYKKTPIDWKLE